MEDDEEYNFSVPGENPESEGWVRRLREAVNRVGGNRAAARLADVPLGSLNNYLAGRQPRLDTGLKLARALGVSAEWLISGEGNSGDAAPQLDVAKLMASQRRAVETFKRHWSPLSGYAILPRYDVAASAGEGALVSNEQVVEFLAFREDWLRDNIRRPRDALSLIEARGDSMEPTIRHRDLLIVDTTDRGIANGAIHVVEVDGALLVKRLERRLDGTVVVHSDNRRYTPETLDARTAATLRVVGQVVWQGGPVRS